MTTPHASLEQFFETCRRNQQAIPAEFHSPICRIKTRDGIDHRQLWIEFSQASKA
jgi:hypothetical protein